MNVIDFIALCISAKAIPYEKTLHNFHYEKTEQGTMRIVNDDPFFVELKNELASQDISQSISWQDIQKMSRGLKYSLIIDNNKSAQIGIDILTTLTGVIGSAIRNYKPFEDPSWIRAIGLLKGYIEVNDSLCRYDLRFPDKDIDRARVALELKKLGAKVSVNDSDLEFDDLDKLFADLENQIVNFGGRHFIERILSQLDYNNEFGRFVIHHKGNEASIAQYHDPDIPYNYLFNLGLKHLSSNGFEQLRTDAYFWGIIDLAKKICFATFTVEAYSFWENIYLGDKNPMEYITDFILKESVFNLNQTSFEFIVDFVHFICNNKYGLIDESKLKFTLKEYRWLIDKFAYLGEKDKFKVVSIKDLKNKHIRESAVRHIIDGISMPLSEYNKDFSSPIDYENVNFWNYPIGKIDDDNLILFPQPIMARGWYEGLISLIRQVDINIDSETGTIIEQYLYHSLGKKNIECISGTYTLPNHEAGECDGLIESQKEIVLIEVKKRSLVRQSRSGIDYYILNNLCDVLKAQLQCYKTSYGLISETPFKIESKDKTIHEMYLGTRNAERISLTLFPYGSIQDRVVFMHIIELFLKYKFEAIKENPDDDQELKKTKKIIREKLKPLVKIVEELNKYLELVPERRHLFNSWFMDLEQLKYLINKSVGPEEFVENLLNHKHLSTGTLDFYNEELAIGYINK